MFSALHLYRTDPAFIPLLDASREALAAHAFVPCQPSQEKSGGWVPPRGDDHGPLIESVAGHWHMEYMIEVKTIPGALLRRKVDERCAKIEEETRRKPGSKERKAIKEDLHHELMPHAFPTRSRVLVWFDPERHLLALDKTGSKADAVITALVMSLPGMSFSQYVTAREPGLAMTLWLAANEPPENLAIDRTLTLKATDESKAQVAYKNHPLDTEEVRQHIERGMRATSLAMTFQDRVSFIMQDDGGLASLTFSEKTDSAIGSDTEADAFDANAAIMTGELRALIADLIEALGGLIELEPAKPTQADLAGDIDPILPDAIAVVREHKKASISLVQRHLHIGYNRAARLLENMEQMGIVSAMDPDGARKLLKPTADALPEDEGGEEEGGEE